MRNYFLILHLTLLLFSACTSSQKAHPLAELLQNPQNAQGLTLETKPDFSKLCEDYQTLDSTAILRAIEAPGAGFFAVSYGLHYLGNRYFQAGDFQRGYACIKASALDYLNPMSMLKLGQIAFTPVERMARDFPKDKGNFQTDLIAAYRYTHRAMDLLTLMMDEWGLDYENRYVFDMVSKPGLPFLDLLNSPEFDAEWAKQPDLQSKLQQELQTQRQTFQKLFAPLKSSKPQPQEPSDKPMPVVG